MNIGFIIAHTGALMLKKQKLDFDDTRYVSIKNCILLILDVKLSVSLCWLFECRAKIQPAVRKKIAHHSPDKTQALKIWIFDNLNMLA